MDIVTESQIDRFMNDLRENAKVHEPYDSDRKYPVMTVGDLYEILRKAVTACPELSNCKIKERIGVYCDEETDEDMIFFDDMEFWHKEEDGTPYFQLS